MDIDRTIVGVLSRFTPKCVASSYLLLQGLAVAAWWVMLVTLPESRGWFFPESLTGAPLMSFWLADIGLLVGGSLLASWLVWTGNPAASPAAWFLSGAWYYPAIYCLTVSLKLGGGELGVAAMFVGGGLTLSMATVVGQVGAQASGFRPCSSTLVWTGIKTFLQIVVFWGTFLFVLPYTVQALDEVLGLPGFDFPLQVLFGAVLFVGFGSLGLWSANRDVACRQGDAAADGLRVGAGGEWCVPVRAEPDGTGGGQPGRRGGGDDGFVARGGVRAVRWVDLARDGSPDRRGGPSQALRRAV